MGKFTKKYQQKLIKKQDKQQKKHKMICVYVRVLFFLVKYVTLIIKQGDKMVSLSLQNAFGWNDDTTNKVGLYAGVLVKSGLNLEEIADSIRSKKKDFDITIANNWIKFSLQEIMNQINILVEEKATDKNVKMVLDNLVTNFQPTIKNEESAFNNIIDYFITDRYSINNIVDELIIEVEKALKYWLPVFKDWADDAKENSSNNEQSTDSNSE